MKHSLRVPGRDLPNRKMLFLLMGSILDCTGPHGLSESPWQACHPLERQLPLDDPRGVPIWWGMGRMAEDIQWLWLEITAFVSRENGLRMV